MFLEQFIDVRIGDTSQLFIRQDGKWCRLDARELAKRIHHYKDLTPKAQIRHMERWVNENALSIVEIQTPAALPNVYPSRCPSSPDILHAGARSFLQGRKLFEYPTGGWLLLADCLCGFHAAALRQAAPSLRFVLRFQTANSEICDALTTLIDSIIPRCRWKRKHYSIKRQAVLDCSAVNGPYHTVTSPSIKEYSRLKLTRKGCKITQPFPYEDTVVLMLHADSRHLREVDPHVTNAALLLVDSAAPGKQFATNLTSPMLACYDPDIVTDWQHNHAALAALMYWWYCCFDDEVSWASAIVQKAKRSFPAQNTPYIRVEVEPDALRQAVRYNVVCSFLQQLEAAQLMRHEEVAAMCEEAKAILSPAPLGSTKRRHMEDPDVFIELMREIVANNEARLVPEDMPFCSEDKPLAAWRRISNERVLIFLEEDWAKVYAKAAKASKVLDCSLLESKNWKTDIQKQFCQAGLIKAPSAGFRYRYNLFKTDSKNKPYVVAVLVEKLGL